MRTSKGFTLVELIAVMVIMSLLAGVVLIKAQTPLNSARMRDVVDQIVGFDRLTRSFAVEQNKPVHLVMDLAGGELRRTDPDETEVYGEPFVLPRGCRLARLLLGGEEIEIGSTAISFSRAGMSASYGLLVEGPGGRQQWLVVPGLTGLAVEVEDEHEARDILDAGGQRPDSH